MNQGLVGFVDQHGRALHDILGRVQHGSCSLRLLGAGCHSSGCLSQRSQSLRCFSGSHTCEQPKKPKRTLDYKDNSNICGVAASITDTRFTGLIRESRVTINVTQVRHLQIVTHIPAALLGARFSKYISTEIESGVSTKHINFNLISPRSRPVKVI